MTWTLFVAFLAKTIKAASIYIFGSTGEIVTEKSGHLNMGIPGIMFMGALGGILGENIWLTASGNNLNPFMIRNVVCGFRWLIILILYSYIKM